MCEFFFFVFALVRVRVFICVCVCGALTFRWLDLDLRLGQHSKNLMWRFVKLVCGRVPHFFYFPTKQDFLGKIRMLFNFKLILAENRIEN